MNGPGDTTEDDVVQQRVVSAADCSPLRTAAASSVFNWRGAGTAAGAAPEPPAASPSPTPPPPEEEETMATRKLNGAARAKNSKRGSPQLSVCTLLLQEDLGRDALAEKLSDLTSAQISSALNNSKGQGRIAWIEKDQVYRLTTAGKEWVGGAGGEPAPKRRKAGTKKAHTRKAKKPAVQVDTSPPEQESESTFRCAVMSDGSFFISRDETAIELTPQEHAHMLRYLERMAEA